MQSVIKHGVKYWGNLYNCYHQTSSVKAVKVTALPKSSNCISGKRPI